MSDDSHEDERPLQPIDGFVLIRHTDGGRWYVAEELFREMVEKGELEPGCAIQ